MVLVDYNECHCEKIFLTFQTPIKIMVNINTLNAVIKSIDGGILIQKFINDLNKHRSSIYAKSDTFQNVSVGISIFLNDGFVRSHHFGKKDNSVTDTLKSIYKGAALIKAPENIYRSLFLVVPEAKEKPGGAIRSNGITIAVSGLRSD